MVLDFLGSVLFIILLTPFTCILQRTVESLMDTPALTKGTLNRTQTPKTNTVCTPVLKDCAAICSKHIPFVLSKACLILSQ